MITCDIFIADVTRNISLDYQLMDPDTREDSLWQSEMSAEIQH